MTNTVFFWTEKVKSQQQYKKQTYQSFPEPGIEPGTSGCAITSRPPKILILSIAVELFYCFNVMGRNINKQGRICRPDFDNKVFFL